MKLIDSNYVAIPYPQSVKVHEMNEHADSRWKRSKLAFPVPSAKFVTDSSQKEGPLNRPTTPSSTPSGSRASGPRARSRVERYGSRATVSFESLHIRIPLKFCQNSAKLSQFFRNSENFRTSQHFLECWMSMFGEIPKKSSKSVQNSMKMIEKSGFCERSLALQGIVKVFLITIS